MIRATNVLTCFAAVGIVACTAKSDKAQDSMIVTGDTSMTTSTTTTTGAPAPAAGATTSTTPAPATTTGSAATTTTAPQPNHSININTASDAEILSIPGMGPRMLREFKEYRPYTSIGQFRREIGKYVDKAEVARLESYITIK